MKKLLLTLGAALVCASSAFADATITVKDVYGAATISDIQDQPIKGGDFTVTFSKGEGKTAPAYNKAGDVRAYAKNTITIAAANDMTKIVFTVSTQGLKRLCEVKADVGTIATQASGDATVTWTGNAKTVVFTVDPDDKKAQFGSEPTAAGQFDFTVIEITGGGSFTGGGTTPVEPGASLNENFANGIPADWTNVKVSGDKEWYQRTFNGTAYATMTGYNGAGAPYEAWLISSPVDMSKAADKKLTFRSQNNNYNSTSTTIGVYVLTTNDPATGNPVKLNATFAPESNGAYSEWAESGDIDLSAYTGTIYIGFKYLATDDVTATWCVTDVKLNPDAAPIIVPDKAEYELATSLEDGSYVFVADGKVGTAIAATATYGRLNLVDVVITDNKLSTEISNALTVAKVSGGYTFQDANNRYLGFDGTHKTSFQLYTEVSDLCVWNCVFEGNNVRMTLTVDVEGEDVTGTVGVTKGASGTWYTNLAPSVGATEILLPQLYRAANGGVENVDVNADAAVEYFNLQGVRVENPANGLYIRRQGNKVSKVIL